MTREDIIRMFHEAGEAAGWKPGLGNELVINYLTHFANIVAAEVGVAQWHRGYTEGQAAEREACAQVAEWEPCMTHTPHRIATAIRARSHT